MLRWLTRLLGLENPTRRELMACRDVVEALDARVDQALAEIKKLRGVVHAVERWRRQEEEPEPEPENGHPPRTIPSEVRPLSDAARLALRFRGR